MVSAHTVDREADDLAEVVDAVEGRRADTAGVVNFLAGQSGNAADDTMHHHGRIDIETHGLAVIVEAQEAVSMAPAASSLVNAPLLSIKP
jgi:hypothetical protein